jgi:hypothetical protein
MRIFICAAAPPSSQRSASAAQAAIQNEDFIATFPVCAWIAYFAGKSRPV